MLDQTINASIARRQSVLRDKQNNVELHNTYAAFEKARVGEEGDVRTNKDGSKFRKVGGKWVPIIESKKPPGKASLGNKSNGSKEKIKEKTKVKSGCMMPSHVSRHHVGALRHIKALTNKSKFSEAHSLASALPDEVKHEIPSSIWEKMVRHSHENTIKEEKQNTLLSKNK